MNRLNLILYPLSIFRRLFKTVKEGIIFSYRICYTTIKMEENFRKVCTAPHFMIKKMFSSPLSEISELTNGSHRI